MQELKVLETKKITGGGISAWGIFAIGTAIAFLVGVIDGFTRPLKCN